MDAREKSHTTEVDVREKSHETEVAVREKNHTTEVDVRENSPTTEVCARAREGDEREEEGKRIRSESHQNGGAIVKGTDSRKEMLAAAGRAAAIAAIAAAAAHQASFPSGRTIED